MITQSDDGQDFGADDPLVVLRPTLDFLGAPPGRYEKIRRGAARRRLLRIAVGAGMSGAVALLVVLPLHLMKPGSPAAPAVPLGPPPASSPSTWPVPSPTRPATGAPVAAPPVRPPSRTPTAVSPSPSGGRLAQPRTLIR